ncbi:uncharacterized protein AB9W97_019109 isoform 3-T7 [Spinachia spinachia]
MANEDPEGIYLGTFEYDKDGPAIQTFELHHEAGEVFSHVKLRIRRNWGDEKVVPMEVNLCHRILKEKGRQFPSGSVAVGIGACRKSRYASIGKEMANTPWQTIL